MYALLMIMGPDVPTAPLYQALADLGYQLRTPATQEEALSMCANPPEGGQAVLGAGDGCPWAMLLAARYPIDALVLVGCPVRVRQGTRACPGMRGAMRRIFAVVADLLIIQPDSDKRIRPSGAQAVLRAVNSKVAEGRILPGATFQDLFTTCVRALAQEIARFLTCGNHTNALAKQELS